MSAGRRITLAIGLAMGLTVSASLAQRAAPAPRAGPSPSDAEADVVRRVNAVRAEHMRPPLRVDRDLARIAREYSCTLLGRGALSHMGTDGTTVSDRDPRGRKDVRRCRREPRQQHGHAPAGGGGDRRMDEKRRTPRRTSSGRTTPTRASASATTEPRTTSPRYSCDRAARVEAAKPSFHSRARPQTTLTTAWRPSRTAASARRSAGPTSDGVSARSPWPSNARTISS